MRRTPALAFAFALGAPLAAAQQVLYSFPGEAPLDAHGTAVAGIGDVDGDGTPDLCVGTPGDDDAGADSGSIGVYSGATGQRWRQHFGDAAGHLLGIAVAGVGDLNGDGRADYAAAAAFDNGLFYPSGYVRIYSGISGAVLRTFSSSNNFDAFGFSLAGAGDVNRDGFDDVVIGAPEDNWAGGGAGAAYVYSGSTGALLHTLRGEDSWDWFGWSVAGLGDVNGDGYDDFAVGIRLDDRTGRDAGAVRVYHGRTGAPLYTVHGPEELNHLGFAIAATGDVDGDGFGDFIATGMNDKNNNIARTGMALLCSGADGAVLLRFAEEDNTEAFGFAATGLGDVDGDGAGDLAISAPYFGVVFGTGLASGEVRVLSGRSGRELYSATGVENLDFFGNGVAAAGDLDGDGLGDLLVGSPGTGDNGSAFVIASPRLPQLDVPDLFAGQFVTLSTSGSAPGDRVTYLYSLAGFGVTAIPGTGAVVDLASPVVELATLAANAAGVTSYTGFVPPFAGGYTVYIQAYVGALSGGWLTCPSAARTIQ